MHEFTVVHRIYTHAAPGNHFVIDFPYGLKTLDPLMESIKPLEEPCFVVRRFMSPEAGGSWACVIAAYPSFVVDAKGRPTTLTHARLIWVPREFAYLDAFELARRARELDLEPISRLAPEERLNAYVARIQEDDEKKIEVKEWSATALEELQPDFIAQVSSACLTNWASVAAIDVPIDGANCDVESIAKAWSAIPIALQPMCVWSVGAARGSRVHIVFKPGKSTKSSNHELLRAYVEWLIVSPHEGKQLIFGSTARSSAEFFDEIRPRVGQAATTPVQPAAAVAPVVAEKPVETQRGATLVSANDPASAGIDPALVRLLNAQIAAASTSIRNYVDERFELAQPTRSEVPTPQPQPQPQPRPQPPPPPAPVVPSPNGSASAASHARAPIDAAMRRKLLWAGGIVLGVFIVITVFSFLALAASVVGLRNRQAKLGAEVAALRRALRPPPLRLGNPPPPQGVTGAQKTDPTTLAGDTWLGKFKTMTETQPARVAVALERVGGSSLVSDDRKKAINDVRLRFLAYAKKEGNYPVSTSAQRHDLRKLLFEYLVSVAGKPPTNLKIDGDPSEITADSIAPLLGKQLILGQSTDPVERQSEAVVRWIMSLQT